MNEGMLQAELEEHLGENGGSKNGTYPKTVRSDSGSVTLDIPRDREGEYQPQLIPKGQRNISGIDDKVIGVYARGMSLRDIERQILDMYDTLIGRIIDKITKSKGGFSNDDALFKLVYLIYQDIAKKWEK